MRKEKYNGHTIEMYDSIEELPIERFQKYSKYLLVESNIGGDLDSVLSHIDRAKKFISVDATKAVTELDNMRQAVYLVYSELSPKYMAFASLVYSIDGKLITDISDEGLKRVVQTLSKNSKKWLDSLLDSVKKKIDSELKTYFPKRFSKVAIKDYYGRLAQHTRLTIEEITEGKDNSREKEDIERYMLLLSSPTSFSGQNSAEVKFDKDFETMKLTLSKEYGIKEMTVLQFYNAYNLLEQKHKKYGR